MLLSQAHSRPSTGFPHRKQSHGPVARNPAHRRYQTLPHASAGAADWDAQKPSSSDPTPAPTSDAAAAVQPEPKGFWQKLKHVFLGGKLDKERLKALGMGAFASYGVISNLNYGTCLGVAWLAFVKQYGVAPTAPGQWKVFLAFYAGLWAMQNFARPLRISLALALAPAFDKIINLIAEKTRLDKKWAFGLLILTIGIITSTTLFGTIFLLGGFPQAPGPVIIS